MKHICRIIAKAGHAPSNNPADQRYLEAVATIRSGLLHEQSEVREVSLGAANRIGILDHETLCAFFDDPALNVRYRAVELAPSFSPESQLVDTLISALADPDVAEVAAFALGELNLARNDRHRAEAVLTSQALNHDDALCREAAVAALGALETGLEAILKATDDVATVRRRAVLALAPFEGDRVEAALAKALQDRDWQVRQAAEDLGAIENLN